MNHQNSYNTVLTTQIPATIQYEPLKYLLQYSKTKKDTIQYQPTKMPSTIQYEPPKYILYKTVWTTKMPNAIQYMNHQMVLQTEIIPIIIFGGSCCCSSFHEASQIFDYLVIITIILRGYLVTLNGFKLMIIRGQSITASRNAAAIGHSSADEQTRFLINIPKGDHHFSYTTIRLWMTTEPPRAG